MIKTTKDALVAPQGLRVVAPPSVALVPARVFLGLALALTLWAVFSLPSILFSQWFPLDLGGIFMIGENFQYWLSWIISPYNSSGRYFPFYWIYNSFQFYLFGTNVSSYYFVQSIVFFVAALLTSATLHKITGAGRSAA